MLILAVTCHRSCNFMSKMENQILATYGYEYTNSMTNHIFGGLFQRLAAEKFLSWSWWGTVAEQQSYPCSLLGTRHPDLITAVLRQLDTWWVRRVLTERARLQCLLSDSHSLWVSLVRVRNIGLDKKKKPSHLLLLCQLFKMLSWFSSKQCNNSSFTLRVPGEKLFCSPPLSESILLECSSGDEANYKLTRIVR